MSALTKWRQLTGEERQVTLSAAVALAVAPLLVRCLALPRVMALKPVVRKSQTLPNAARIKGLIDNVAMHLPWSTTCLHRALVSRWLLLRHGVATTLVLGVRTGDEGFAAHAWLEHDGHPLCAQAASYCHLAWRA
ncbi:MAG TPA: lasso peptide biosynthesis B2 protein [Vicinamibacterales bacterium]|nr:lasso peptide biosynthesis B2 protein [Vicinamibacterales bacterium]